MKKILLCFGILLIVFSSTVFATNVQLNGKNIDFTDSNGNKVEAQIINNRTMVPLRKIFELLGCNVDWEASTQTITAIKDDRKIVLQINNKTAKKTIGEETTEIKLDSAPVIVNDRTLVPLRFIAESLGKQVGWDAVNGTAIIIDYTYFENRLKTDAPALYFLLKDNYGVTTNSKVEITRKYYDFDDSTNNNTATIIANIVETKGDEINQKLSLTFSGNNPLMQDILREKWNNSNINITYGKDSISYITSDIMAKMIGENNTHSYKNLGFELSGLSDLEDGFRNLIGLNENKINIDTFNMIKEEFDRLCNLFNSNNSTENTDMGTRYTWNFNTVSLKYANTKFNYFDLTKLDNIIFNNEYVRAYSVINKKIFNYDVKLDELMYDTNDIKISGKVSVLVDADKLQKTDASITLKASDEYNEQFEYTVKIDS